MCQGSELGLLDTGGRDKPLPRPWPKQEGCSSRIRRVQIPLLAWCPSHACHVQGIRWPDSIIGHSTPAPLPSQSSQEKKPLMQESKWKDPLPHGAAAAGVDVS